MEKLVCNKFCSFYKPGKEGSRCGSYDFLSRNLTYRELSKIAAETTSDSFDLSADSQIKSLVCEKTCRFYANEDCDFRLGLDSPPCGGYAIMEKLLKWT